MTGERDDGPAVLVTGAASGIGLATAALFASHGARVVVADIDLDGAHRVAGELRAGGASAVAVRCDVSVEEDVAAMVALALERFGRLDAAFNNAGIEGPAAAMAEMEPADWARVLAVNLTGTWYCMRHEVPAMRRTGGGAIVNCASIAGLVGFAGAGAYTASKHGVVGLTRAAALECAGEGIRVNAVCPGVIDTPMNERNLMRAADPEAMRRSWYEVTPLGYLGTPRDVAYAMLFLACDESRFITGTPLVIDGGRLIQ